MSTVSFFFQQVRCTSIRTQLSLHEAVVWSNSFVMSRTAHPTVTATYTPYNADVFLEKCCQTGTRASIQLQYEDELDATSVVGIVHVVHRQDRHYQYSSVFLLAFENFLFHGTDQLLSYKLLPNHLQLLDHGRAA